MSNQPLLRPIAVVIATKGGKPKGDPRRPSDKRARSRRLEQQVQQLEQRIIALEEIISNLTQHSNSGDD